MLGRQLSATDIWTETCLVSCWLALAGLLLPGAEPRSWKPEEPWLSGSQLISNVGFQALELGFHSLLWRFIYIYFFAFNWNKTKWQNIEIFSLKQNSPSPACFSLVLAGRAYRLRTRSPAFRKQRCCVIFAMAVALPAVPANGCSDLGDGPQAAKERAWDQVNATSPLI